MRTVVLQLGLLYIFAAAHLTAAQTGYITPDLDAKLSCVGHYACNVHGANLLGYYNISDSRHTSLLERIDECQSRCRAHPDCEHFTWYDYGGAIPSTCYLYSSCDSSTPHKACKDCHSGPRDCSPQYKSCPAIEEDFGGNWFCFPEIPSILNPVAHGSRCIFQCPEHITYHVCEDGIWSRSPGEKQCTCPPLQLSPVRDEVHDGKLVCWPPQDLTIPSTAGTYCIHACHGHPKHEFKCRNGHWSIPVNNLTCHSSSYDEDNLYEPDDIFASQTPNPVELDRQTRGKAFKPWNKKYTYKFVSTPAMPTEKPEVARRENIDSTFRPPVTDFQVEDHPETTVHENTRPNEYFRGKSIITVPSSIPTSLPPPEDKEMPAVKFSYKLLQPSSNADEHQPRYVQENTKRPKAVYTTRPHYSSTTLKPKYIPANEHPQDRTYSYAKEENPYHTGFPDFKQVRKDSTREEKLSLLNQLMEHLGLTDLHPGHVVTSHLPDQPDTKSFKQEHRKPLPAVPSRAYNAPYTAFKPKEKPQVYSFQKIDNRPPIVDTHGHHDPNLPSDIRDHIEKNPRKTITYPLREKYQTKTRYEAAGNGPDNPHIYHYSYKTVPGTINIKEPNHPSHGVQQNLNYSGHDQKKIAPSPNYEQPQSEAHHYDDYPAEQKQYYKSSYKVIPKHLEGDEDIETKQLYETPRPTVVHNKEYYKSSYKIINDDSVEGNDQTGDYKPSGPSTQPYRTPRPKGQVEAVQSKEPNNQYSEISDKAHDDYQITRPQPKKVYETPDPYNQLGGDSSQENQYYKSSYKIIYDDPKQDTKQEDQEQHSNAHLGVQPVGQKTYYKSSYKVIPDNQARVTKRYTTQSARPSTVSYQTGTTEDDVEPVHFSQQTYTDIPTTTSSSTTSTRKPFEYSRSSSTETSQSEKTTFTRSTVGHTVTLGNEATTVLPFKEDTERNLFETSEGDGLHLRRQQDSDNKLSLRVTRPDEVVTISTAEQEIDGPSERSTKVNDLNPFLSQQTTDSHHFKPSETASGEPPEATELPLTTTFRQLGEFGVLYRHSTDGIAFEKKKEKDHEHDEIFGSEQNVTPTDLLSTINTGQDHHDLSDNLPKKKKRKIQFRPKLHYKDQESGIKSINLRAPADVSEKFLRDLARKRHQEESQNEKKQTKKIVFLSKNEIFEKLRQRKAGEKVALKADPLPDKKFVILSKDQVQNEVRTHQKTKNEGNVSSCLHPAPVANGRMRCKGHLNEQGRYPVGSKCYLSCNPGFATQGHELATCGANGAWLSESPLQCDEAVAMIIGGWNREERMLDDVEVYDPFGACGSLQIAPLPKPRRGMVAGWIRGSVVVCGGLNETSHLNLCWKFDPKANAWNQIEAAQMTKERHFASTAKVQGQLIVLGGRDGRERPMALGTVESFERDGWQQKPQWSLSQERAYHCSNALNDETVVITGGYSYNAVIGMAEGLNVSSHGRVKWGRIGGGNLNEPRYLHGCATIRLRDNTEGVLVAGGYNSNYLKSAEIFDPTQGSWRTTTPLSTPRQGGKLTVLYGKPTMIGGFHSMTEFPKTVEQFDVEKEKWSILKREIQVPRRYFALVEVPRSMFNGQC